MAFFQTNPLKKSYFYGSTGKGTTTATGLTVNTGSHSMSPKSRTKGSAAVNSGKKTVESTGKLDEKSFSQALGWSDDDFVHNINQIIRRKNFSLIDRQAEMNCTETEIQIRIDAAGFLPHELQVRLNGLHEERADSETEDLPPVPLNLAERGSSFGERAHEPSLEIHGEHLEYYSKKLAIRRQLVRCYLLPLNADVDNIQCSFSKKDGCLSILVPRLKKQQQILKS